MTDRAAGRGRLGGLARRLARRRGASVASGPFVAPVTQEVYEQMVADLDVEGHNADNVKGGTIDQRLGCPTGSTNRCPPYAPYCCATVCSMTKSCGTG